MRHYIIIILGSLLAFYSGYLTIQNWNRDKLRDNKNSFKITFDFIETAGGRMMRMSDCHTGVICFSAQGQLSCVAPTDISDEYEYLMEERCR